MMMMLVKGTLTAGLCFSWAAHKGKEATKGMATRAETAIKTARGTATNNSMPNSDSNLSGLPQHEILQESVSSLRQLWLPKLVLERRQQSGRGSGLQSSYLSLCPRLLISGVVDLFVQIRSADPYV